MYTKQEIIIKSYREGKSQRCISRELQISRKTVKKYIEEYETALANQPSKEDAQCIYLSKPPEYKSSKRPKLKFTREVQEAIDHLLELNEQKMRQGLRKQLLKKKDILEELHRQGHDIGYTTVCTYISTKKRRPAPHEAYIRQVYQPGDVCEFDWGEIKLYIRGKQVRLQLAVFTSAYSNYRYAFIYNRQDTLSFMESHVRFFDVTGGFFNQMVYDNMRVAVSKFVGPHEKKPTRALLQLRGHYGFTHRFCNAYRGNEKGHVERSVEYVRRKAFGLKDKFTDEQEAQKWLCSTLNKLNGTRQTGTGKTANELFGEEKKVLGKLPPSKLICSEQVQLRVDKYATISYRTNRYSVADHLVGQFVDVHILSNSIQVYYQNKSVCSHPRSYGKHRWIINIEHYLSTFRKKPGALANSVALAGNTYLKQLYLRYFSSSPRNFIDLLSFCRQNKVTDEQLENAVKRLLSNAKGELTTEKLCALLGNKTEIRKPEAKDKIYLKAKEQLSALTTLIN
jgi:transposase